MEWILPVRQVGTWKDRVRRAVDAAFALSMPAGTRVAAPLLLVDGYLYPHEAVFLYWVARSAPGSGVVVEVGSMRGRSTLCLAAGIRDGGREPVYAVDPHRYGTRDELGENIAHFGLTGHVEMLVDDSVTVAAGWQRPVRAVFVDGDHRFESALADVSAWSRHLAPGGFLLLHDSTELNGIAGPRQVARLSCCVGAMFDKVGTIGSITWARRTDTASDWSPPEHGKWALDGIMASLKRLRRLTTG
ncbi:MAG: class I SAM-dependent methyltransferase [Candidatus Polarisedimenticolia bacterium]